MDLIINAELLQELGEYTATFFGVGIALSAIGWGIGYVITVITRTVRGGY